MRTSCPYAKRLGAAAYDTAIRTRAYDKRHASATAELPTATPARRRRPTVRPGLAGSGRRGAARRAVLRARPDDRGQLARGAHRPSSYDELDARGLTFRPHFWLSAEWFSPDGVPGVAIPVLPRASAADAAREGADARGRRRHAGVVPADPAARSRTRVRQRLRAAPRGAGACGSSARRRRRIRTSTCRGRTRRASSCTSTPGTRKAIPTKTSPRRSPSG